MIITLTHSEVSLLGLVAHAVVVHVGVAPVGVIALRHAAEVCGGRWVHDGGGGGLAEVL